MPKVSIVMPTYNRADTILRAIGSIQSQTFTDWELIIINDGSTDNTLELVANLDERIRVVTQPNQGVTTARNTGLRHCRGDFFAFLDSDDRWRPIHLELCIAFLQAHPTAQFVACELLEDFGNGKFLNHYQVELTNWYLKVARLIGSHALDLPAGETDSYLRVYKTRQLIGEWGKAILDDEACANSYYYQGNIFPAWRWGFLMWLPTMVLRRAAVEQVGQFSQRYPICSDFDWMADCCRQFTAHFLGVPTGIKHDLAVGGKRLAEGHIAKDKTANVAALDMLHHLENNYCAAEPENAELAALRSHKQYYLAKVQLARGFRDEALHYLKEAWPHSPEKLRVARLWCLITLIPNARLCQNTFLLIDRIVYAANLVWLGDLSVFELLAKIPRKLLRINRTPHLQHV